ncbi:hypothetical protein HRbin20_00648 [bacterium HR20]|nr:hypothetical protein HRbin20_00648 [bacterium HR20]
MRRCIPKDCLHLLETSRCLFCPDDALRKNSDLQLCFREHVHASPRRNVVEDNPRIGMADECTVVLEQTALRWFVVVGRHNKHRINAKFGRSIGQLDGRPCAVCASAGDHRNTPIDREHSSLDNFQPFRSAQSCSFAC